MQFVRKKKKEGQIYIIEFERKKKVKPQKSEVSRKI